MLAAAEAATKAAKRRRGAGPGPSLQAAMFQELEIAEQHYAQNSKDSVPGQICPKRCPLYNSHSFLQWGPMSTQARDAADGHVSNIRILYVIREGEQMCIMMAQECHLGRDVS